MNRAIPLIFSGTMIFISGFLLLHSYIFPPDVSQSTDTKYGLMFYPRIILFAWLGCAVALFLQYLTRKRNFVLKEISWRLLGISIGLTLLVCILLDYLGFLPACIAFCFAYPFLLGYRNVKVLIPVSILYAVGLWFVFNKVLLIILPASPWF
ncbi:tripartite tricarboxylate transporter TctB family protein [Desulfovibrio sp. OttesenSCG-928-O18]|nr:tripartite tricarboxylate transporter TctB family protein [Desulfovibrio sp. OttesenSCG-928-O18]